MRMRRAQRFCVLMSALFASVCLAGPRVRPERWARPVIGAELKNWYKLDEKLYRSEQPDEDAFEEIEAFGVKAVLNLRNHHSDDDEAKGRKLTLLRLETNAGDLTYGEIVTALRMIRAAKGPVLVHCWHGSDRTGAVCAAYRIAFHGWTPAEAVDEMLHGGYGFHASLFAGLAKTILAIDPVKLRREAAKVEEKR